MKKLMTILGIALLALTLSFTTSNKKIVVIDAGHGGKDYGLNKDGVSEKEIAMNIANKIKTLNTKSDLEIILTRNTDKFLTLEERVAFINSLNPDAVISLHVNSAPIKTKSGFGFFVCNENEVKIQSNALASILQKAFQQKYTSNEVAYRNIFLLKNVNSPATLIELGYLSNENDRKLLLSEKGQSEIAAILYKALK